MSDSVKSPGDIVDARCTRCRTVTNHIVVAMVETRIARVQCNTCGGTHNYHPPKPAAEPRPARQPARKPAGRKASSKPDPDLEAWLACCSSADPAAAVPYAMTGSFRLDDLVAHPAFGVGLVTALQPPDKMEVLFREGRKLLRCGPPAKG